MAVTLFNTLAHKKQLFRPQQKNLVTLYTCGPTVYRSLHIGNYRTYIFEDILERTLILNGYKVRRVMNITDVGHLTDDADNGEDKFEREALHTGRNAWDISKQYTAEFIQDLHNLNIIVPEKMPRATDHIKEQIALIKTLGKKGFIYQTSDGIYFDTSKLKHYGALAGRDKNIIQAGKRVALGGKRNPTDFALWKFSGEHKRQMEWDAPWGRGFPGWHIECSAMAMKYLGKTIDIHCGGIDHKETHHPNEIAQSESATGKKFVRFWMHGAFLTIKGAKMAKSNPDTNITLRTLKERGFDPLDFRYLTLGTHYRKPLSFSWDSLTGARTARLKLIESVRLQKKQASAASEKDFRKKVMSTIGDDLNAPKVLALVRQATKAHISKESTLWAADDILGLNLEHSLEESNTPSIPPCCSGTCSKTRRSPPTKAVA